MSCLVLIGVYGSNSTQAWSERLQVVLLLNKIDRLILELKMSVSEAAATLVGIVTEINAYAAGLYVTCPSHGEKV